MRLVVLAFDFPYPPNRGGRADIWRRILAMRALGHNIMLIAWQIPGSQPSAEDISIVEQHVHRLVLLPSRHGLMDAIERLFLLPRWPSYASARRLSGSQRIDVQDAVTAFRPEALWCEGPHPGAAALQLARGTAIPLVYRSHNIEHRYMRRQARAARRWRDRMAWHLACIGLERFETRLMASAHWVFDISWDDMAFWQARGLRHTSWLPPVAESALASPQPATAAGFTAANDVVFLGNLTTPNNVRGVEWLVQDIRPRVLAQRPGTRFVVAGSNPGPHVRRLCDAEGVQLMPDVADALALYRSARVLVNPVRTGSGTHVKAIEMLMMAAPIVTATQGTMGLPPEVKGLFRVADTAETFAGQVLDALRSPCDEWAARADARRLFGVQGVADALAHLAVQLRAKAPHTDTPLAGGHLS